MEQTIKSNYQQRSGKLSAAVLLQQHAFELKVSPATPGTTAASMQLKSHDYAIQKRD